MRQQPAQPAIIPEEAAEVPPPRVDWGADVTFFQLLSIDGTVTEKSIHTNLIHAVSTPIKEDRWGNTERRGLIDISKLMPGVMTEVFDILIKWLYTGQVRITAPSVFEVDQFWALVFQMSEHFEISALKQVAFSKFEACLLPRELPSDKQTHTLPSKQLLEVLFHDGDCTGSLQTWMVDHIYWIYECVPSLLEEIEVSMKLYPLIAAEFCARLFQKRRSGSSQTTKPKHPSEDETWAETHSLSLTKLKSETNASFSHGQAPANNIDSGRRLYVGSGPAQDLSELQACQIDRKTEQSVPRESSADTDRTDPEILEAWLRNPLNPDYNSGRRTSGRVRRQTPVKSYNPREYFREMNI